MGGGHLHYRILERLGAGGMGEVHKAEDLKLRRLVALKRINPGVAREPLARARFLREARAASRLNHPNVVTIHAIEEGDDSTFLVMEYVEGESLAEKLGRGPLPFAAISDIGAQVADGLAAAHAAGVVHRDIKPGNVLVTATGTAKVLDFGIAQQLGSAEEGTTPTATGPVTTEGTVMGTPAYMAPEQLRGEPTDARSDVFSLGCVLYEMITGRRPFERSTPVASMLALLNDEPASPSSLRADTTPALERLVRRAPERPLRVGRRAGSWPARPRRRRGRGSAHGRKGVRGPATLRRSRCGARAGAVDAVGGIEPAGVRRG